MKYKGTYNWINTDNIFFLPKRLVFDNAEKPTDKPTTEAAPKREETVEVRRKQALADVDEIYDRGEYSTYNFRALPEEYKNNMRSNFEQWIRGKLSEYDKEGAAGIDVKEYEQFKASLEKKVTGVLNRLVQIKENRKAEAKQEELSAKEAQDRQNRLREAGALNIIDDNNLESMDGLFTEMLAFQEDFRLEAESFGKLSGAFSKAKDSVDNANKSHHTGLGAVKEYAQNLLADDPSLKIWIDDLPEVKVAKEAKDNAIKDFKQKLAAMKKNQKDRQARGKKLNSAPERIRVKTQKDYSERRVDLEKNKTEKEDKKKEVDERITTIKNSRDNMSVLISAVEQKKGDIEGKQRTLSEKATEFNNNSKEAGTYENVLTGAVKTLRDAIDHTPEPQKSELVKKLRGLLESQDKAKKTTEQYREAGHLTNQQVLSLEGGQGGRLDTDLMLGDLNVRFGTIDQALLASQLAHATLDSQITNLGLNLSQLNTQEQLELDAITKMDTSVADMVIEIDTSNFELVRQGEEYLEMLESMHARGPGSLDAIGATLSGIPGFDKAYDSVGGGLSSAWGFISKTPVIGDAIEIVGYMGEGWSKGIEWIGSGLGWIGDKLHLQDAWDWMSDASKHLEKIGASDSFISYLGGGVGTVIEVFAGVTEGAKDLVKALGMLVAHPFDTIVGLKHIVNHPGILVEGLIHMDKWDKESPSKIIGRALLDIGATLLGGGATAKGAKAASTKLGSLLAASGGRLSIRILGATIAEGVQVFGVTFAKDIYSLLAGIVKAPGQIARWTGSSAIGVANLSKKGANAVIDAVVDAARKRAGGAKKAGKAGEEATTGIAKSGEKVGNVVEDSVTVPRENTKPKTGDEGTVVERNVDHSNTVVEDVSVKPVDDLLDSTNVTVKPEPVKTPNQGTATVVDRGQRLLERGRYEVGSRYRSAARSVNRGLSSARKTYEATMTTINESINSLRRPSRMQKIERNLSKNQKLSDHLVTIKLSFENMMDALRKRTDSRLDQDIIVLNKNPDLPPEIMYDIAVGNGGEFRDALTDQTVRYYKGEKINGGSANEIDDAYYVLLDNSGGFTNGPKLNNAVIRKPLLEYEAITKMDEATYRYATNIEGNDRLLRPLFVGENGLTIVPKIKPVEGLGNAISLDEIAQRVRPDEACLLYAEGLESLSVIHRADLGHLGIGALHLDSIFRNMFFGKYKGTTRVMMGDLAIVPVEDLAYFSLTSTMKGLLQRSDWKNTFPASSRIFFTNRKLNIGGQMLDNAICYVKQNLGRTLTTQERLILVNEAERAYVMRSIGHMADRFENWCDANPGVLTESARNKIVNMYDDLIRDQGASRISYKNNPGNTLDEGLPASNFDADRTYSMDLEPALNGASPEEIYRVVSGDPSRRLREISKVIREEANLPPSELPIPVSAHAALPVSTP